MSSANNTISPTPEPPYYAVIFTSLRTVGDNGFARVAGRMEELAKDMPGYLGVESVRDARGVGITVSYWKNEESMRHWKQHAEHMAAQKTGKALWYADYTVRVAKVERAYRKKKDA